VQTFPRWGCKGAAALRPYGVSGRYTGPWLGRFPIAQEATEVRQVKVIVEKHPDGYVAYPLGLKGVVVGEGDTYEEALADVKSAIAFHVETFGPDVLGSDPPVLEVFVAETGVAV